jgi:transcriptional regulator GlxA family with amidase domain
MTEQAPRRLLLGLLALDGVMLSGLAGPTDLLRVAQKLAELQDPHTDLQLQATLISARGASHLHCSSGLRIEGLGCVQGDPDVLLVPAMMHGGAEDLIDKLDDLRPEIELIRGMHARGVRIASACSGAFLLAEAGLLDGRRATTSWWLDAVFQERYPNVAVDIGQMMIEDGPMATSGATSAVLSYVLRLVARVAGEELAQQTARILLLDPDRQSQAPYISQALRQKPRHSLGERIENLLQQSLDQPLSVASLAERAGTSERSLLRHFRAQFGVTPQEHLQRLRVERAKALLETTRLSFDEIVERCGYADSASFRKLFKRATSLTPSDYRERFRLRPH